MINTKRIGREEIIRIGEEAFGMWINDFMALDAILFSQQTTRDEAKF
jgi:hypothetical protein